MTLTVTGVPTPGQDVKPVTEKIAEHLLINSSFSAQQGLNGKFGAAIFLHDFGVSTGSSIFQTYARELIAEVRLAATQLNNVDYYSGISGIGAGFSILPEEFNYQQLAGPFISRSLKPLEQADFLSGLLGQALYVAGELPPLKDDWKSKQEYIPAYAALLDMFHVFEKSFHQIYDRLLFECTRQTFDPIIEEGGPVYLHMLYNLSRLCLLVRRYKVLGLNPSRTSKLEADVYQVVEALLEFHLLRKAAYFLPATNTVMKFALLHMVTELVNSRYAENIGPLPLKEKQLYAQVSTVIAAMLPGIRNDKNILDNIINITVVLQAMCCRTEDEKLLATYQLLMTVLGQALRNLLSADLGALNDNVGIFHGWAKIGLLLHAHGHPEERFCRWHHLLMMN